MQHGWRAARGIWCRDGVPCGFPDADRDDRRGRADSGRERAGWMRCSRTRGRADSGQITRLRPWHDQHHVPAGPVADLACEPAGDSFGQVRVGDPGPVRQARHLRQRRPPTRRLRTCLCSGDTPWPAPPKRPSSTNSPPAGRSHRGQALLLSVHPDRSRRHLPGAPHRPAGVPAAHRLLLPAHQLRRLTRGIKVVAVADATAVYQLSPSGVTSRPKTTHCTTCAPTTAPRSPTPPRS